MQLQRRSILKLLFILYFSLYVISPLCYTEDELGENQITPYKAKPNSKNIHVVWELILLNFLQPKDSEKGRSDVQLLIKKTRAIVSTNNLVKFTQSESAEPSLNCLIFPLGLVIFSIRLTKTILRNGSYLSFSGLSPPSRFLNNTALVWEDFSV